jgi:hypothetical protein
MQLRLALAFSLMAACAASDDTPPVTSGGDGSLPLPGDGGVGNTPDARVPDASQPVPGSRELGCTKMDVLFVIDNSASMQEEQAALAENFPRMVSVLDQLRDGVVDYRVGVTTTSFGTSFFGLSVPAEDGELLKSPDMATAWLARGEADLAARFATLATVGTEGSGDEQPLRAAREAVTSRVSDGKNAAFFRKDALLAIVVITDEDDGSSDATGGIPILGDLGPSTPVADIKGAIDNATGGSGRWAAAVIAGRQVGGCQSAYGDAADAERLREFTGLLGANGVMGDICSGNLAGELQTALDTFTAACESFSPLL